MAWTIYKSTDASAPQLTAAANSVVAIFRACLVNGYGSKAASGWLEPFTAASNRAVFKPNVAGAHFLSLDDSNTAFTQLTGYEMMLGLLDGRIEYPQIVARPFNATTTSYTANARIAKAAVNWVLIADATTVYFLVANAAGWMMSGFGKLKDAASNDPSPWFCFGLRDHTNGLSLFEAFLAGGAWNNTTNLSNYQCMGLARSYAYPLSPGYAYPCNDARPANTPNTLPGRRLSDGALQLLQVDVYEYAASSVTRGRFPGMLLPKTPGADWATTFTEGSPTTVGSLSLVRYPCAIFTFSNYDVLFDLSGTN